MSRGMKAISERGEGVAWVGHGGEAYVQHTIHSDKKVRKQKDVALIQTGVLEAFMQRDYQWCLIQQKLPGSYFSVIQVRDGGGWNQSSVRQMDQQLKMTGRKPVLLEQREQGRCWHRMRLDVDHENTTQGGTQGWLSG